MGPLYTVGPAEREIALETSEGQPISNAQITEVTQFEWAQYAGFEAKFGTRVLLRSGPTPRYNCHGMTFAARRTGIFEPQAINLILDDDGYQEIPFHEVLAGDVIIYYDENEDPQHSAVVVCPPPTRKPRDSTCLQQMGEVG